MSYEEIKTDLEENVSYGYTLKIVTDWLTNFDITFQQSALILNEYESKFGEEGVKALHFAMLADIQESEILHDINDMRKNFFQPRTLDLWQSVKRYAGQKD